MIVSTLFLSAFVVVSVSAKSSDKGFDQYGYNKTARNFVGTCTSWYQGKFGGDLSQAQEYCGEYTNDKLVMKWNAEWDRGNDEDWANGPYDAWENNEWNGRIPGGSGEVWHYKIKWVGDYTENPELLPAGSYGIWGQFAVLMDQGSDADRLHTWLAKSAPNGYGVQP